MGTLRPASFELETRTHVKNIFKLYCIKPLKKLTERLEWEDSFTMKHVNDDHDSDDYITLLIATKKKLKSDTGRQLTTYTMRGLI